MVGAGLFGVAARRLGFDTAPVVLALVLGPEFETALRQAFTFPVAARPSSSPGRSPRCSWRWRRRSSSGTRSARFAAVGLQQR
jgi:hypothetical protein